MVQTGSPHKIERKIGDGTRYIDKAIISREEGRRQCCLYSLNPTVVHDIFHHGDPLVSLDESPPPTLLVYSSNVPIQMVFLILILFWGLIQPPYSISLF